MPLKEQRSGLGTHQSRVITQDYDIEEDEAYYTTRQPTSTRRYQATQDSFVFQQGNRRFIVHPDQLPVRQRQHQPRHQYFDDAPEPKPQRHFHPLVFVGIAIFIMIVGWIALSALGAWWQSKQDDWTFGTPRTFQTDANVGHGTTQIPMSHFIAINLHGQIFVIEIPGNDASKSRIYPITTLQDGAENTPATLSFRDINADGKVDMLITLGDPGNQYTIFLLNNGTQFVSKL